IWGLWVDDDKLVDIRQVLVASAGVVGVGGTAAIMGSYKKSWIRANVVGHVDVKSDIVRVGVLGGAQICDLLERGTENGGGAEKDSSQSGEVGGKFDHCCD